MTEIKHGPHARASDSSIVVVNKPTPIGSALTHARDEAGWYPYQQTKWTPWTCVWTADVSFPPSIGNGTLDARYLLRDGPQIDWKIFLSFGTTTNGGRGGYTFSLPYPVVDGFYEQNGSCKAFTQGPANWHGFVFSPLSSQVIVPFFPVNGGVSFDAQAQNADLTGAPGTGVPATPGNITWTTGFNICMWGNYEPKF